MVTLLHISKKLCRQNEAEKDVDRQHVYEIWTILP